MKKCLFPLGAYLVHMWFHAQVAQKILNGIYSIRTHSFGALNRGLPFPPLGKGPFIYYVSTFLGSVAPLPP